MVEGIGGLGEKSVNVCGGGYSKYIIAMYKIFKQKF